jgi:hypothetical protein
MERKEVADAINEIHTFRRDPGFVSLVNLIDHYIDEIRKENDTARIMRVKENQGKVAALKKLRDNIVIGLKVLNV